MARNEIVVGLDDSPSARAALRWAAEQAIRQRIVLRAIHVLDWPSGSRDTTFAAPRNNANQTFDEAQARYLAGITGVFDDISPRPDWFIQFATGEPGPALVRQSNGSQLLALGTREHVGLGRLLAGSISHYCLKHAPCPVAAVPSMIETEPAAVGRHGASGRGSNINEIVVGVDLSPPAGAALAWAAKQARATGQTLRAVHAVDVSPAFNMELGMGAAAVPVDAAAMDPAYRDPIAAIFEAIRPEPNWHLRFSSGEPGPVLVAESDGAGLLVVGTKEHVGIGRLVSGSVSHYCISRAQRPVVAVPAVRDGSGATDHDQGSQALRLRPEPTQIS
jgi:nucleotide-binding universal stress UspA family protein